MSTKLLDQKSRRQILQICASKHPHPYSTRKVKLTNTANSTGHNSTGHNYAQGSGARFYRIDPTLSPALKEALLEYQVIQGNSQDQATTQLLNRIDITV